MSAINNHSSSAMRVLANPYLNTHLFSFMGVDDLERMKCVSKRIPRETLDNVVRERVFSALFSNEGPWNGGEQARKKYGKDLLRGITIRNFPREIPLPLSSHKTPCMAGYRQVAPGVLLLYTMHTETLVSRSRCLPDWNHSRNIYLQTHLPIDFGPMLLRRLPPNYSLQTAEIGGLDGTCCCCAPCRYRKGFYMGAKEVCFDLSCLWLCCYQQDKIVTGLEEAAEAAKARGPKPQVMN